MLVCEADHPIRPSDSNIDGRATEENAVSKSNKAATGSAPGSPCAVARGRSSASSLDIKLDDIQRQLAPTNEAALGGIRATHGTPRK